MSNRNDRVAASMGNYVQLPEPRSRVFFRFGSVLVLAMVCIVTAGVSIFAIRDVRTEDIQVEQMYAGSVRGLRRIGDLMYQVQETRRSTHYALSTSDSNLQVQYADQSREADRRVREAIAECLKQTRTTSEVEVGKRLQNNWAAYLKVRDEVLGLILEGSTKEAVAYDLQRGVPAFESVREDLEQMKKLYDEQALQRLAIAAASGRRSVTRLIVVLFLTFLFSGFAVWAVHRSRMHAALELAKLQMEFVAGVSHELRTPLSVLCLAAENIADGVIEGRDELARYGSMMRNQARQITGLVDQILLFASTKDRKSRYALRPVPVSQLVETVLDNVSELLQETGFVVEQHIEPDLPDVIGDSSALSQCLQNLVLNAVKYGAESRWIGIRACTYEAKDERGREIRISVEDRGIGIAKSEMARIFEPFYRSPEVLAAQIHGTGLGLSLARNIVEVMGGRITVTSKLGVGSIFTLHLRIAEVAPLQATAVSSVHAS
jgi:signal transduction histidine kinase